MRVLIFSTVWPEPSSSAAGVRQMQWIHFFLRLGAQVILSSPSKLKNEQDWGYLNLPAGVECVPLPLNQSEVGETLKTMNPDVVMFDRFILEEQFGHFVYEACPAALVLIETEDLHFIRKAREELKEQYLQLTEMPEHFYHTTGALRETASMERADQTFVCSTFEAALLKNEFSIDEEKVTWVPFFYDEPVIREGAQKTFEERDGFAWVGNFRHPPNLDGLRWFRKEIWPRIKVRFPKARIKIYGAYPTEEVMQWNRPQDGFSVLGSAEDLSAVFENARVNLAPLRFGAGIKGKLLEGFRNGVPSVSTAVGVEGLAPASINEFDLGALVVNTPQEFAEACIKLHEEKPLWEEKREQGKRLMREVHSVQAQEQRMRSLLESLLLKRKKGVLPRWNSKILRHETFNSYKYFSRWIEEKEKKRI